MGSLDFVFFEIFDAFVHMVDEVLNESIDIDFEVACEFVGRSFVRVES